MDRPTAQDDDVIRLEGAGAGAALLVRRRRGLGRPVVYVHGATFCSALSVGHRIDGRSWIDDLQGRGHDVWAFDFLGYGGSDRPPTNEGRATAAADQIARVVAHIGRPVTLLAHSWGSIPAARHAAKRPDQVDGLILFGGIGVRQGQVHRPIADRHLLIDAAAQWDAFQEGVPVGETSPIDRAVFEAWAERYLQSDVDHATRTPPAVRVPGGPGRDVDDAWSGSRLYEPAAIRARTMIVRGAWDAVCSHEDAESMVRDFTGSRAEHVTLPCGGHRMHLERGRQRLFDAVGDWLAARA